MKEELEILEPYTATQVAKMLGVDIKTLKRIREVDLPFFRVASRGDRRYEQEDVRKYKSGFRAPK